MENKKLKTIIKQEILENDGVTIERYMELCLYHPEHGYYMTQNPIGAKGDFTTAPEISGLFGETIGLFIARVLKENC